MGKVRSFVSLDAERQPVQGEFDLAGWSAVLAKPERRQKAGRCHRTAEQRKQGSPAYLCCNSAAMAEALRHGMNSPELRLFRMLEEIRQCAFSSPDKRESTSHSQEHVAVSGAEKEDLRLHQKLERTAYPKFRITAGEKAWEARAPDGSGIGRGGEGQSY